MSEPNTKFIGNYFRDRFSRPFMRRLRYVYLGLNHTEDTFVLSDTEDTEFKYCEPLQTTGLIKIINTEHLAILRSWFAQIGCDGSVPMLMYFGNVMTLVAKMTTPLSEIKIRKTPDGVILFSAEELTDIIIARPCDTHFTLTKLQGYVDKYSSVFFDLTQPSYSLVLPEGAVQGKICNIGVPCQEIYKAGLLDKICYDVKLVLLPGLDNLLIKSLLQKNVAFSSGVRLWADSSPQCLNYGGYYTDPDVSLCVVRDNIFLFPKAKPEQDK